MTVEAEPGPMSSLLRLVGGIVLALFALWLLIQLVGAFVSALVSLVVAVLTLAVIGAIAYVLYLTLA